jgi:hypothetical protein
MDPSVINTLFEPTKTFNSRKESLSELRVCYKKYTGNDISKDDFIQGLKDLNYEANKNNSFKLKMKKQTKKCYLSGQIGETFTKPPEECSSCGWRCEYEQSHVSYGGLVCRYINVRYFISLDDDGEVVAELRNRILDL